MSYELLSESYPVAQKTYYCDACNVMSQDPRFYFDEMTFSEKRTIVKARKNDFHIIKGQKYVMQTGKFDGEFTRSRCIPDAAKIASRLGAWENF